MLKLQYVNFNDILDILIKVSSEENLTVTLKEPVNGGVVMGASAFLGALLLGPPGLAVGSAVGGCIVYYRGMGKFKSVVEVIQEMPYEKKKILVNAVMDAISHLDITDLNKLAALVFNKDSVKKLIIDVLVFFLERTYNYKVNH